MPTASNTENLIRPLGVVLSGIILLASQPTEAAPPTCNSSGNYCSYSGTVAKAYIHENNLILMYFDTPVDLGAVSAAGISGVTNDFAAGYSLTANADFGKALFAALLAAQGRGATINIQMRNSVSGYLRIDRIWLNN